jgi:hypothetical protein
MRTLLCTLMLATLSAVAANADIVTVTFDQPVQTGSPGETLQFFGTITNLSGATVFLNSDDLNVNGLSLTTNDLFLSTVPISLAPNGQPGDSSGDIELFDVIVSNPLLDAPGTYLGSYDLLGGADGNAADVLTQAGFSVNTVPEPSLGYGLLGAASGILLLISRKTRERRG